MTIDQRFHLAPIEVRRQEAVTGSQSGIERLDFRIEQPASDGRRKAHLFPADDTVRQQVLDGFLEDVFLGAAIDLEPVRNTSGELDEFVIHAKANRAPEKLEAVRPVFFIGVQDGLGVGARGVAMFSLGIG
jgi:hypothetical protein